MFVLTQDKNNIESGTYATYDVDGITMLQFFVDKDDAMTYNEQLSAIGYDLSITETPDEAVDKLCDLLGFAYTVVEPGELVVPRFETMTDALKL